jgi:hypothetical protein
MDEVFDFLATHVTTILFIGLAILIIKIISVYLLIVTKTKKVVWNLKLIQTNFFKFYTPSDIKKTSTNNRKTFKRISNSIKSVFYIWLILLALALFFQYAQNSNSDGFTPTNNNTTTPNNNE